MSEQESVEAVAVMERRGAPEFTREQIDLIKRTVAQGTDDTELALFLEVARRTGLDPFSRQIYAVMRYDTQAGRKRMTIQTGLDGYFAIAERTGLLAGVDDVLFDTEDGDHPNRATASVYRMVHGVRVPFTYTARWKEYIQTDRHGEPIGMWKKMPFTMLGKCALARALRMGFTAQLSGVYTSEEMTQADSDGPLVTVGDRRVNPRTGEIVEARTTDVPALPAPVPIRPAVVVPDDSASQSAPPPAAQVAAAAHVIHERDQQSADAASQRVLALKLRTYFGADETGEYKALRAWLHGQLRREVSGDDLRALGKGELDVTHKAVSDATAHLSALMAEEQSGEDGTQALAAGAHGSGKR